MTPICWVGIGVAFVAGVAVAICALRGGPRGAALRATVTHVAVTLTDTDRHNWVVRLDTHLENHARAPARVVKVACEARAKDGRTLAPHRICGDHHQAAILRSRAPDLAMRLPFDVRKAVDFTFEMVFEHRLAQFWPGMTLWMTLTTESGNESVVEIPVPRPATA